MNEYMNSWANESCGSHAHLCGISLLLFSHVREMNEKEKLPDLCVPISIELFLIWLNI
jgi:hypothetical protein